LLGESESFVPETTPVPAAASMSWSQPVPAPEPRVDRFDKLPQPPPPQPGRGEEAAHLGSDTPTTTATPSVSVACSPRLVRDSPRVNGPSSATFWPKPIVEESHLESAVIFSAPEQWLKPQCEAGSSLGDSMALLGEADAPEDGETPSSMQFAEEDCMTTPSASALGMGDLYIASADEQVDAYAQPEPEELDELRRQAAVAAIEAEGKALRQHREDDERQQVDDRLLHDLQSQAAPREKEKRQEAKQEDEQETALQRGQLQPQCELQLQLQQQQQDDGEHRLRRLREARHVEVATEAAGGAEMRDLIRGLFNMLSAGGTRPGHLGKLDFRCFESICGLGSTREAWDAGYACLCKTRGWKEVGPDREQFVDYVIERHRPDKQMLFNMMGKATYFRNATAIFNSLDRDKDGHITKAELKEGMRQGIIKINRPGTMKAGSDVAPRSEPLARRDLRASSDTVTS